MGVRIPSGVQILTHMIEAIYSDSLDDLTLKMIGYYHDHCHHLYIGTCKELPEKYIKFGKSNKNYVFLYSED